MRKERFTFDTTHLIFNDNTKGELLDDIEVCELLNQQDQRIAELEEQLKNATKQVRKEVLGDLKEELKKNGKCSIRVNGTMDFFIELDKLNEILDQIQER